MGTLKDHILSLSHKELHTVYFQLSSENTDTMLGTEINEKFWNYWAVHTHTHTHTDTHTFLSMV